MRILGPAIGELLARLQPWPDYEAIESRRRPDWIRIANWGWVISPIRNVVAQQHTLTGLSLREMGPLVVRLILRASGPREARLQPPRTQQRELQDKQRRRVREALAR